MKLKKLTLSNFQSFGPDSKSVSFKNLTFLIGANGSGKTAVLQALCRMFAFDPNLRRVTRSDFHVPATESPTVAAERSFVLEADFTFPELKNADSGSVSVPAHFSHMRLVSNSPIPRVRFRLEATLDIDGSTEDTLYYVLETDNEGNPVTKHNVPRSDRNNIHFHYLPARRDPSAQVAYTANSLLGRTLRAANWKTERESIKKLTAEINSGLTTNKAVHLYTSELAKQWKGMHKGSFFSDAKITFANGEIEALLRHMSISFTPGHDQQLVDFARLSDGQKSMLYLSLVLSTQSIGEAVLRGDDSFDLQKLKPALYTLVGMEEPENSLSPHYLGRIVQSLTDLGTQVDAQALIATHAPSMLRRIAPEQIRYLRLNAARESQLSIIKLPPKEDESHKFVREAVQAYPELYFSRLVLLGEGDSEEIVLHRLLQAKGLASDDAAISIAPLGGRHVNHFWALLSALDIPCLTLLDLDLSRFQGGWGRARYAVDQHRTHRPDTTPFSTAEAAAMPKWNSESQLRAETSPTWIERLEDEGVFFSGPLDLDFSMLAAYPQAYGIDLGELLAPDDATLTAVLGPKRHGVDQYSLEEQKLFKPYHERFKLGSKPTAHLTALSTLTDEELLGSLPAELDRLLTRVAVELNSLPE